MNYKQLSEVIARDLLTPYRDFGVCSESALVDAARIVEMRLDEALGHPQPAIPVKVLFNALLALEQAKIMMPVQGQGDPHMQIRLASNALVDALAAISIPVDVEAPDAAH